MDNFAYDHFIDNYKVVAISFFIDGKSNEINIHALGTDSWRKIQDYPYSFVSSISTEGVVSKAFHG
jgi:hypothetical protein